MTSLTAAWVAGSQIDGAADDGLIGVWINNTNVSRSETVASGLWSANFSVPGDEDGEENTQDLVAGDNGAANQCDPDNDCTWAEWSIPNPVIHVDPQHDRLAGFNWPAGGSVTIQIDEDTDPGNGMMGEWTGLPVEPGGDVWFDVPQDAGFDLAAGHFVRMIDEASTDPMPTKETQVNPLRLDEPLVVGGSLITGTGDESIDLVNGQIHSDPDWTSTSAVFVGSDWSLTFSHPLTPGMYGSVIQGEQGVNDGDATEIWWRIPNPAFTVQRESGDVWGDQFEAAVSVTVTLWDGLVDLDHFSVVSDGLGQFGPSESVSSGFGYALSPGDVVTADDGVTVKSLTVSDVAVTGVNPDTDVVSGTAAEGTFVQVWVHNTGQGVDVEAGGTGAWVADLSSVGLDIVSGTQGAASQRDDDGDQTQVDWSVPNPVFSVDPVTDNVRGDGWTTGSSVLIQVENQAGTVVAGPFIASTDEGGRFGFNLFSEPASGFGHDVVAGDVVVVEDSDSWGVKDHTVTLLALTDVDVDGDSVSGTAVAGSSVWVNIHKSGC